MNYKLITLLSALLLLSGCQTTTNFDYDENVNFSTLQTYAWVIKSRTSAGEKNFFQNDINNKRIVAAIESNLSDKGLRKVAPNEADVLVDFYANVTEKQVRDIDNTHPYFLRFGRGYHGRHFSSHINAAYVQRKYKQGALVIDFLDNEKQLIWRGSDQARLQQKSTPEKRTSQVNTIVSNILKNFKQLTE